MNGNLGFNLIPNQSQTIFPSLSQLPSNSLPLQSVPFDVAFQSNHQQFQSAENSLAYNGISFINSQNAVCVNQNGSTFLAITPNPGIQCVQTIDTPQGLQLIQVLPNPSMVNPSFVNFNPFCVSSVSQLNQVQMYNTQYTQNVETSFQQNRSMIMLQSNASSEENEVSPEVDDEENLEECRAELDCMEDESEPSAEPGMEETPLEALASLTTAVSHESNEPIQQVPSDFNSSISGIENLVNGGQQVVYTNVANQQLPQSSLQSFQILVPTPQGMSVQTLMASSQLQLVNPLPGSYVNYNQPTVPQLVDTQLQSIPVTPSQSSLQFPVEISSPMSVVQVKSITSACSSDSAANPSQHPAVCPAEPSTIPGPTASPQLPDSTEDLCQPTIKQSTSSIVDGIDLEEIREFARTFKMRRLILGLTQTQVGQALSATEGPAYSQSAICRFEKLDITPRSAAKIRPVLERWLKEAEEKHQQGNTAGLEYVGLAALGKIRKRRTFFSPEALAILNGHFDNNSHPTGREVSIIANQIGYDRDTVRVWFCNKRQSLRQTAAHGSFQLKNRISVCHSSTEPSSSLSPLPSS